MAINHRRWCLFAGILPLLSSWVDAQAFLAEDDGTVLTLGYPDSLSTACQGTFNQSVQCNSTLGSVARLRWSLPLERFTCTDMYGQLLRVSGELSLRSNSILHHRVLSTRRSACSCNLQRGSAAVHLQLYVSAGWAYCAPLVEQWSQDGPTAEQSCSECMLRTFQVELDSPFGYEDEFASYFSSLTSSCGVSDYPITSPPPYTGTATTTSSSAAPSTTSCASHYTVQGGDDCLSVSKAQRVSTAMLRYENGLTADCSNFPEVGTALCIPAACDTYTLQANETCYDISQAHNASFTVTQLVSWNPDVNRDCSNLEAIVGTQLCVSSPGGTGGSDTTTTATTTAEPTPAPSNVVNGTNLRCAKYYEVVPGDTCSSVTVMMAISLSDFYFLNPEVNNPNCTNLLAGYSYCVQAVGDIATYSGYGGNINPCMTSIPVPSSCFATGAVTTDTAWTFPTYTTNATQPTTLPLAPGTLANCSTYTQYYPPLRNTSTVNSCYVVASIYDESVDDFVSWNPSLSYDPDNPNDCQLQQGSRYCAHLTTPTPTVTSTSTTSTTTSQQATSTGPNGEPTPLPVQMGITNNCDKFYLVQSNDGCYDIAAANDIALSDFYSWNPALNGDCSGLYPDYYVCVGIIPTTITTSTTTTTITTTTTGGIQTPTPTQIGMATGCTDFYLVQSGDGCYDIAAAEGISLPDLYAWNPALNGDCSGLWPDYYLCVGRGGASSITSTTSTTTTTLSTTTTTTTAGTTPTPTQTGMVSGCQSFYLVQSGDGCYDIAASHGITLDQFYSYNPAVGSNCAGLWPDYYVCVGV